MKDNLDLKDENKVCNVMLINYKAFFETIMCMALSSYMQRRRNETLIPHPRLGSTVQKKHDPPGKHHASPF